MRGMDYLFFVVMIGVFVYLIVAGATNFNEIYSDNQINTSNFTGKYNQIELIQEKANESYNNFQKLGSEDTSWFQKIGAGIVAIPYAVINFPIMVVVAISALLSMITITLGGIVPATIILAMVTFLVIEAVRRFLEFFQRARA